jgi:hypothetical protein
VPVLGEVIAEREFVIREISGSEIDAIARIGRPHIDESGDNWVCPYEINVAGESRIFGMHGIDSFQALELTIKMVEVEIGVEAKKRSGKLFFLEEPYEPKP